MDSDAIGAAIRAIPFNSHLGLEVVGLSEGKGIVRLPDLPSLRNHIGSQHAGALFAAAEAASGVCLLGRFAERLGTITPLAKGAKVSYLKIARGVITATASFTELPDDVLHRLDAEGKVQTDVHVVLVDADGLEVAKVVVQWHIRKNPS
jgi:acyl-coenzyme A thioesterase PaaI-like protein